MTDLFRIEKEHCPVYIQQYDALIPFTDDIVCTPHEDGTYNIFLTKYQGLRIMHCGKGGCISIAYTKYE